MKRIFSSVALALAVCALASAATVSTTLTVTSATVTIGTSISVSGPATLTGGIGSGTFSTGSLSADASGNFSGTFTIKLAGSDSITGTFKLPAAAIGGTSFSGASMTVSGGTGAYSGATGSFPSLSGSATIGLSITLSFSGAGTITTGGGGGGGTNAPTITAVQDAAANTANLAQGTIFIVKGSNLSPSGYTPFAPPRPTVSNGIKVTFTPLSGGTGTDAYLVYLFNQNGVNQIAGIVPSTVAPGNYNVTVTNGTVSSGVAVQVVASKLGLFTQDSSGTGLAVVQNYISATQLDINRLTTGSVGGITISPAKPGQTLIAWGTGLAPLAAGDNSGSGAVYDFSTHGYNVKAIVGGVSLPVLWAGPAGYPGEDQINFTLPSNIPTGCAVTFQVSVNGVLSNTTSIAIAPDANSSACVFPGYTTAQLQTLDQGGTITSGAFSITQFTISSQGQTLKSDSIGGGFSQLTGFQLSSVNAQTNINVLQSGSCQVIQATSSGTVSSTGSLTYLDAGAVTISGPSGSSLSNTPLKETNNSYSISNIEGLGVGIPGQTSFSLPAGSYTLNGAGGTGVGPFNTSIALSSPLTITGGLPSTVSIGSPLTLNWTGGAASDSVEIIGSTSSTTGSGSSAVTTSATFICLTTAGPGTFTVPGSITGQMFKTTSTTSGVLEVASGNTNTKFTTTLKSDGSSLTGYFGSFLGVGNTPAYQ